MRNPVICLAYAVLMLGFWSPGLAADAWSDSITSINCAQIRLSSDIDSAHVYLDTVFVGLTPLVIDSVTPGSHRLRILPPRADSWLTRTVDDTLSLKPGETLARRYTLREFLAIDAQPSGAMVYLGDSLLGVTPSLLPADLLLPERHLSVKKDGFESFSSTVADLKGIIIQPLLKPGWQTPPLEDSPYVTGIPGWSARRIGLYVSGGTSVLAGIVAAYCKIAADDRQASYLASGDPAMLAERRRLDTWAGITFALTQVGFAIFSYLLISE